MGETLIVTQVQISFASIVKNVYLAMLIRAHRSRINVDVWVEFLHSDRETATLQQHANRRACQTFSKGTYDSACNKNMFCHKTDPELNECLHIKEITQRL